MTHKSDWFSAGLIFYQLLEEHHAFGRTDEGLSGPMRPMRREKGAAVDVVKAMLEKDAEVRRSKSQCMG